MSDDTIQFIADVHRYESLMLPDEYVLDDIAISIESYLKDHDIYTFSMSVDANQIFINVNKKDLKRFKLMGHICITEYFQEHDTMLAKLLPTGHTEEIVTSYIEWEKAHK